MVKKEATDKEISLEELKETLEDANSGITQIVDLSRYCKKEEPRENLSRTGDL